MLYQICHGAVSFGDEEILHDINFEIRNTEKIAVVGRNGCGKTTLLKLIHGEVDLEKRDSDEDVFIAKAGNPQIGYLKQIAFEDPSITLEQEVRKVFAPMERRKKELEARNCFGDRLFRGGSGKIYGDGRKIQGRWRVLF